MIALNNEREFRLKYICFFFPLALCLFFSHVIDEQKLDESLSWEGTECEMVGWSSEPYLIKQG